MSRLSVATASLCLGLLALVLFVAAPASGEDVTLEITIEDAGGETVSGVDVTVAWDGEAKTDETLPDGRVAFAVPEGADVTVTVDHSTYERNFPYEIRDVSVPEGKARLEETVPVSLAGSLEVRVLTGGDPIEGADITLEDRTHGQSIQAELHGDGAYRPSMADDATHRFVTDEAGIVEFKRLEQHDYRIVTEKPEYLTAETDVALASAQLTQNVSLEHAQVDVDFHVVDDHFDPPEPIENARIQIPERGIILETFSDGSQFQRLPVNTDYDIEVSKDGYDGVDRTLELGEMAVDFNVSIQRTPSISLDLLNEQVITNQTTRATVTNAYGEPVSGASIVLDGEAVGETDATGSADLVVPSDGEFTVTASVDGLENSATIQAFDPDDDDIPEAIEDEVDGDLDDADDADDEADDADDDGAGFGALVALVAIAAIAVVVLMVTVAARRSSVTQVGL